ncbi:rho guanine nucleotide exchange factor 7-like [Penaeus indicus]|uniref:rho guanine nucleotide exchange factor 7-like n=1 Tax=Penaeus indicus TaxID=29960 RepID=UPI00300C2411
MSSENGILLVEALYSFKGKNNDELCFRKGDIITVTQREEGGWWEGTLDDKTGWFPSNYTKEHKPPDGGSISPLHGDSDLISPQHSQQQQIYRNLVLKDILDSERTHVADLQNLHATHLTALHKSELFVCNCFEWATDVGAEGKIHPGLLQEWFKIAITVMDSLLAIIALLANVFTLRVISKIRLDCYQPN